MSQRVVPQRTKKPRTVSDARLLFS